MPGRRAGGMIGLIVLLTLGAAPVATSQTGTPEPPAAQRPEALQAVPGITVLPPLDAQGRELRLRPAPSGETEGEQLQGCPYIENKLDLII